MSYNSEEKPESEEKALLVAAAGKEGAAPMVDDVEVSEVSVGGALEGFTKAQWQGGPPAASSSMLNEEDSSP